MSIRTQTLISLCKSILQSSSSSSRWQHVSWLLLRTVVGIVMIHNGLDKLSDIEGFAVAYVQAIGLPFPEFFAYVAAYTELYGSIFLILGLTTRVASLGLLSTMCVAIYHHLKVAGLSIPYLELTLLYAACFTFFTINGGGQYSLDQLLLGWMKKSAESRFKSQLESLRQSYLAPERIPNTFEDTEKTKAGTTPMA